MKKINKFNDPLREKPLAYISLSFYYDTRTYKELDMVVSHEILSETSDFCSEKLRKNKNYRDTIHNETINLAFRPMVPLKDLCTSVLRYICCTINAKDALLQYPGTGFKIYSHIDMEDDQWSHVGFVKPEISTQEIDPEFSLIENSELCMTLPSKFKFLSDTEFKFLDGLFHKIHQSGKDTVEMTYGEFWELIEEDSSNEESTTADEMDNILNNLLFYDFISIDREYLEKEHVFRVSLKDLPHYYDFLRQNEVKISA